MKKMKKRVIPLTCVMLLILMATVFATMQADFPNNYTNNTDANSEASLLIEAEPIDIQNRFDKMVVKLSNQIEDDAEFNVALINYKYLEDGYKLETEKIDYLADLIISGYSGIDVIDCAYFWLDTNEDISIVKQMCDWKIKNIEYEGKFWVENAFNAVTNNKYGVLSFEDFEIYAEKGISDQEILIADRLCRKGVYTIQEILEMYENGKSMTDIAIEIETIVSAENNQASSSQYATTNNIETQYPKADDSEIFESRELAIITNEPEKAYYDTTGGTVDIETELSKTSSAILKSIEEELKTEGYFRTSKKEVE